jgi:hypothetical protein
MENKKKTLLSHFYNEEYLLPWFLKQHKNMFDHGIMINYASTDNSIKIIKDICPDWEIIDSRNQWFDAANCDAEVCDVESTISGWKLALNVTEHLIHLEDLPETSDSVFSIHCYKMIDDNPSILPTYHKLLIEEKFMATEHTTNIGQAGKRFIHSFNRGNYSIGRHSFDANNIPTLENSKIAKYIFSPWNESFIKRKMQIGNKIPESDIRKGMSGHHKFPLDEWESQYKSHLVNLFKII